jgi:hypothetical protein
MRPEEVFPSFRDQFKKTGMFDVLKDFDFVKFHTKLYNLVFQQNGLGLAVAVMAQVNVAGNVLIQESKQNNPLAQELLDKIIESSGFVSLGVSEKGWKGQISQIKSEIISSEGKFYLNGSKSFLTNGEHCEYFLVVAKLENNYKVVILNRDTEGLLVTPFSLDYAKEATHCSLEFKQILINPNQIFSIDYKSLGDTIRKSELLSLSVIGIAFINKLIESNPEIFKQKEIRQELLELKKKLDWLFAYVFHASELKSKNQEWAHLFPYGFSIIMKDFLAIWNKLETNHDAYTQFPDLELFSLLKDEFTFVRNLGRIKDSIV